MLDKRANVNPLASSPKELEVIEMVIRRILGGENKAVRESNLSPVSWERFKDFIIYQEISPLVYSYLKDSGLSIPEDLMRILKNSYYYALLRCQELGREFLRILKAFESSRTSILPIKGMHFLYDIYAHLPARPMVDIDLLVKEEDILRAKGILSDLGYKIELSGLKEEYWRKNQCHLAFVKKLEGRGSFIAELHWGLDFKRNSRMALSGLWGRIREIEINGKSIKLLSPEDALFSLALHNRRFGKILSLKNTIDLILLLNKYSNRFDWDYVLKQCREYNLSAPIFFSLYQAEFLRGFNIPEYAREGLEVPRWKKRLIQRFIEKNTFSLEIGTIPQAKNLYLKAHFLLYDSLWEPVSYILNIPQEQFAKYYCLEPYAKKTTLLYRNRLFYIPFKSIGLFKRSQPQQREL